MCDPIALLGLAVSAGSSVMSYQAQEQQYQLQHQMYEQNAKNAAASFMDNQKALGNREVQEQEANTETKLTTGLQAQEAEATALTQANAMGVGGISVDLMAQDFEARSDRYNASQDTQLGWTLDQLQQEKIGAGDQYVDRVNSVSPGTAPSFADAGLRIASAGLGSYTDWSKRNPGQSMWGGSGSVLPSIF